MTLLNEKRLTDGYERQVNYLRLSVTDQCNLSCLYCAPFRPGIRPRPAGERFMSFEEMGRLVRIGMNLGISKVRLTGGEPLCRKGILRFIEDLDRMPGIRDIGLTTNGTRLAPMARALKSAGLNRINISLDTLDPDRFRRITGKDAWHRVWDGILSALDLGYDPVKINTVVMRGVNDDEVVDMARLSLAYPLHVRFIEYMPIGPGAISHWFVSGRELRDRIGQLGELTPVAREAFDGPARRFKFRGAPGEIGFISSMSDHFCRRCNRVRLTAKGFLRPCLLADDQVELVQSLREGATDAQLAALFFQALSMKQGSHGRNLQGRLKTKMVQIGG